MYAETFGINPASAAIEAAAKWVQWAQAGIMAGVSQNEEAIRYNLGQFWEAKNAAYGNESSTGKAQLDRLDTFAHGYWNALETGKIYSSSPGYWEYWKKWWMGGIPQNPDSIKAATAAAAAAAGQQAAAQRTGGSFGAGMNQYAQNQAAAIPSHLRAAAGQWNQEGVAPLGIPIWAWIAGAAGLALILTMPRK